MKHHMNYSQDEFLDLMAAVEDEGGEHLDQICKHRRYSFTGSKVKPQIFPGCGNSALFMLEYDLEPKGDGVADRGHIQVCAVDDAMGAWPRYGAMPHDEVTGGWLPDVEWLR